MFKYLIISLQKWGVTNLPPLQESRPEILGEKRGKGKHSLHGPEGFLLEEVDFMAPRIS